MTIRARWWLDLGVDRPLSGFESGAVLPWDYLDSGDLQAVVNPQDSTLIALASGVLAFQLNVKLRDLVGPGVLHIAIKKNGVQIAGADGVIADPKCSLSCAIGGVPCVAGDVFSTELRAPGTPTLVAAASGWSLQAS